MSARSSLLNCFNIFSLDDLLAEIKVREYLLKKQYKLDIKLREESSDPSSGLKEMNLPRAQAKQGPIFTHHSESKEGPIFISIAFNKKVTPSSTVQDLQTSLKWVSLDKLPMPGFKYPYGWDIYPRTPVSSLKNGVKIISFQNGRLHFKVDTRFFAVYGKIRGLRLPADASAPIGTYFQVRKDIHGLIDVNMPLVFA